MDRDINILTKNKNSYRKMLFTTYYYLILLNQFHYMRYPDY